MPPCVLIAMQRDARDDGSILSSRLLVRQIWLVWTITLGYVVVLLIHLICFVVRQMRGYTQAMLGHVLPVKPSQQLLMNNNTQKKKFSLTNMLCVSGRTDGYHHITGGKKSYNKSGSVKQTRQLRDQAESPAHQLPPFLLATRMSSMLPTPSSSPPNLLPWRI